jgi:hypothetical protein
MGVPQRRSNPFKRRIPTRNRLTPDETIAAIRANKGLLSHAADALGVSRQSVSNMVARHEKVAKAVHEAREGLLDTTEKKLFEKVEDGNLQAILFVASTLGRRRGYALEKGSMLNVGDTNNVTIQNVIIKAVPSGTFIEKPDNVKLIEGSINRDVIDNDNVVPLRKKEG